VPRRCRRCPRYLIHAPVTKLPSQPIGELGDPCGTVQRKQRSSGAITILVVPHQDWDTVLTDRIERILVSDVVADIDRHQRTRAGPGLGLAQVIDHPAKGFSLVPYPDAAR